MATALHAFSSNQGIDREYFPLGKGTYWIYSAHVEWTAATACDVRRGKVTWKSEVTDTFAQGNIVAARIRGFVYDLFWYEPKRTPGDYIIVRVGVNHYYLIERDTEAFWQKLLASDGKSYLEELATAELFLEAPLQKGAIYGEAAETPRAWYCWAVTDEKTFDRSRVPGAHTIKSPTEFTIRFRTNPDDSTLRFVPGIGLTGFEYHHHGTISNCRATLVKFHHG